jgi:hypothetical protein
MNDYLLIIGGGLFTGKLFFILGHYLGKKAGHKAGFRDGTEYAANLLHDASYWFNASWRTERCNVLAIAARKLKKYGSIRPDSLRDVTDVLGDQNFHKLPKEKQQELIG